MAKLTDEMKEALFKSHNFSQGWSFNINADDCSAQVWKFFGKMLVKEDVVYTSRLWKEEGQLSATDFTKLFKQMEARCAQVDAKNAKHDVPVER